MSPNRNGFAVDVHLTHAHGTAERRAAIDMLNAHDPGSTRQITLGADRGYYAAELFADLRTICVTPHIAAEAKGSAVDARTTRRAGSAVSQRKRIEEAIGWGKTAAPIAKTMLRGLDRVREQFTLTIAPANSPNVPGCRLH